MSKSVYNTPMDAYADISFHAVFSLIAGFISWKIFGRNKKSLLLSLTFALIAGVGIDIDHLFDYFMAFGFHFNYQSFIDGENFLKTGKAYIFFHAFEYTLIFGLLSAFAKSKKMKMIFMALSLGILFHLLTDILLFSIPMKIYFLSYRIFNNFVIELSSRALFGQ